MSPGLNPGFAVGRIEMAPASPWCEPGSLIYKTSDGPSSFPNLGTAGDYPLTVGTIPPTPPPGSSWVDPGGVYAESGWYVFGGNPKLQCYHTAVLFEFGPVTGLADYLVSYDYPITAEVGLGAYAIILVGASQGVGAKRGIAGPPDYGASASSAFDVDGYGWSDTVIYPNVPTSASLVDNWVGFSVHNWDPGPLPGIGRQIYGVDGTLLDSTPGYAGGYNLLDHVLLVSPDNWTYMKGVGLWKRPTPWTPADLPALYADYLAA